MKLNGSESINMALENMKESIKTSPKETAGLHRLKKHTSWFDEECLCSLDQRKQAKIQCLQDPNQSNVHNINNVKHEASTQCRNKKRNV
jgi:hypothetical protein